MKKINPYFIWGCMNSIGIIVLFVLWMYMFTQMCAIEETSVSYTSKSANNAMVNYTLARPIIINIDDTAEEIVEAVAYFDVPLSEDLQDHIFKECEKHGIDPAIIVSMIKRESNYRAKVTGDSGQSYGLMQIQLKWHRDRMGKLGVTDLLDPYQNVTVGIDYLAELIDRGKGVEWALMAYNGGPSYANRKVAAGVVSDYAKGVLKFANSL